MTRLYDIIADWLTLAGAALAAVFNFAPAYA